jgi:hypothetical protein
MVSTPKRPRRRGESGYRHLMLILQNRPRRRTDGKAPVTSCLSISSEGHPAGSLFRCEFDGSGADLRPSIPSRGGKRMDAAQNRTRSIVGDPRMGHPLHRDRRQPRHNLGPIRHASGRKMYVWLLIALPRARHLKIVRLSGFGTASSFHRDLLGARTARNASPPVTALDWLLV